MPKLKEGAITLGELKRIAAELKRPSKRPREPSMKSPPKLS